MSKFVNSECEALDERRTKFVGYNSAEYQVIKEVFKKIPMMDTYVANIVEEYIYCNVKEYFDNGVIKNEYRTKYGYREGDYKMYDNKGKLWIQKTYVKNKLHGEYKEWYDDGKLCSEHTYVNGKKHGHSKYWSWKEGKLWKEEKYINGELDFYKRYNVNF